MAQRIQGLDEREASLLMRPVFWMSRRMFGKVLTPLKVQAHRPSVAWMSNLLGLTIEKSGKVEGRLHTLAQMRAAQIVECPF